MSTEEPREISAPVTITVAIQAAEDEEPSSNTIELQTGSGSEDELARHDKSRALVIQIWKSEKVCIWIRVIQSNFALKNRRLNASPSLPQVKHLTRDWRTTAYALHHSELLELNDEDRKVRRRTTVPVFASESLPSRMLLLSELKRWPELGVALGADGEAGATQQERLMELLLKAFGNYGPIASVMYCVFMYIYIYIYIYIYTCMCVSLLKKNVVYILYILDVVLIGTKPPKKKIPKDRDDGVGGVRKSRSLNSRVRELQYHGGDDSAASSSETESNPTSPRLARKSRSCNKLSPTSGGPNHLSPAVSPRSSPWSSPRASPCTQRKTPLSGKSPLASEGRLSPEPARRWADYSSDSSLTPSGSPWVQRRKQVASQESSPVGSPMLGRKIQNADGLPPGVVRLPRGPDGTRGFHSSPSGERGKAASTQTCL
uniref:La ribonucleoprotein 6, translational regulator a n=1 Tax=Sinocyclocheilus anshuiensis TaxID=1608454 RepID=A0A671K304_9TELE